MIGRVLKNLGNYVERLEMIAEAAADAVEADEHGSSSSRFAAMGRLEEATKELAHFRAFDFTVRDRGGES